MPAAGAACATGAADVPWERAGSWVADVVGAIVLVVVLVLSTVGGCRDVIISKFEALMAKNEQD